MLNSGIIVLWSGAIVDIPADYVICDGNNGTPDLRNRFIVGAGATFAVDDTGGSAVHDHDFTSAGHTHDISAGPAIATGAHFAASTNSATDTGTTEPDGALPPFYALAYMMKT